MDRLQNQVVSVPPHPITTKYQMRSVSHNLQLSQYGDKKRRGCVAVALATVFQPL